MAHIYSNNTKQLIQNVGISEDEIYDYGSSPLNSVFEMYFQFCQENLIIKSAEFEIKPALFFFRNSIEVNAGATKHKGYFIIAVNSGTLVNLYYFFAQKADIFDSHGLAFLNSLNKQLTANNNPIFYLMQQLCNQFTYYHELGHLIQKSPALNNWIGETYFNPKQKCKYTPESHVYEFDADIYGAENTAFHILDFWQKQNVIIKTEENLSYLLSVGVASVFTYFLKLMEGYNDIYYAETCHPHPLIRISYIVDSFIQTIKGNLKGISQFNSNKIIQDSFRITEELFKVDSSDQIEVFLNLFWRERKNIEYYIRNDIFTLVDKMPDLVYNRVRQ